MVCFEEQHSLGHMPLPDKSEYSLGGVSFEETPESQKSAARAVDAMLTDLTDKCEETLRVGA